MLKIVDEESMIDDFPKDLTSGFEILNNLNDSQLKMIDLLSLPEKDASDITEDFVNEVGTLIDLMSNSDYNEEDLQKVYFLKDVHIVFTSIARDFEKENFGYDDLVTLLKKVFKFLKKDNNLPKKFKDVYQDLDWYKQLEETYSKTEINALDSVKNLMKRGTFTITFEEVKAEIDEDENTKIGHKIFNLNNLQELLSKLTLHTGLDNNEKTDNQNEINRFHTRINNISRLQNCLIDLTNNGSLLFKDCKVVLLQKPESNFNVFVELRITKAKLGGKNNKPVDHHLTNICDALDKIIKDWGQSSLEKRKKYKYLNFFTNKQILLLQEFVSIFLSREVIEEEMLHLCGVVVENCPENMLKDAIRKAQSEINQLKIEDTCDDSQNDDNDNDDLDENERRRKENIKKLINFLSKTKVSSSLLHFSAQKFASLPLEEAKKQALSFIMKNRKNPENIHKLEKSIEEKINKDVAENKTEDAPLGVQIYNHWEQFLKALKSNNQYISLEELGRTLKALVESSHQNVKNQPSNKMQVFKPTLHICNDSCIWETALKLSINLPSYSQILLANEKTSVEEIQMICSRAKSSSNQRYIILNPHKLNFEAASVANTIFYESEYNDDGKIFFLALTPFFHSIFYIL